MPKNNNATLDGEIVENTIEVTSKQDDRYFTTKSGLEIELLPVDPMKMKRARDSVRLPKRPTYETRTASGKVETWPLDEVSAEQVPNGKSRWQAYLQDREDALSEQNDKVVNAIFFFGTKIKGELPTGWEAAQLAVGIDIPSHPDPAIDKELKKAHYLATELDTSDFRRLLSAIMRRSGASEEDIEEAEGTFRG